MRIRLAVPDAALKPDVLNASLEAVTRTNEHLLASQAVPLADEAIAEGVKWKPEPPGDEHFDHAETVIRRGHGDCDDLAPYKAASLRHTGEDPDARAIVIRSGPTRWHAVVERGDGSIDDPSADAGMYEYHAPVQAKLRGPNGKTHIASKNVNGVWCARCDVPWRGSNYALSGHAMARTQARAVGRAVEGAMTVSRCAGIVEPENYAKLAAFHALLHGEDPQVVRELMREAGQGAAFDALMSAVRSMRPSINRFMS